MRYRGISFVAAVAAAIVASALLGGNAAAGASDDLPDGVTRLSGATRVETALSVADQYAPGVSSVFVATGWNFPDALSAAAAAAHLGGPLLLTPADSVPGGVLSKIRALAPGKIFLVGGPAAVSTAVESQLAMIAPTERLGDVDRYRTGLRIVSSAFESASTAFIATGRSYPDALAATGAAGKLGAPVILVDGLAASVTPEVRSALRKLGVKRVGIVGGTAAVSTGVENSLRAEFLIDRYAGEDRYATAAAINTAQFAPGSTDTIFIATAWNFPDALAGAALAGRLAAPLYVTGPACTPEPIKNSIDALASRKTVVLGGAGVVSDAAAANIGCLTASQPWIDGSATLASTLAARAGIWTDGTSLAYQWFANGAPIAGSTAETLFVDDALIGKRIAVEVSGTRAGYTSASMRSSETAPVPYPQQTKAVNKTCPWWAPIKGNASSMIYHVPGGQFYDVTVPEDCFSTEAAAQAAGYRRSLR